MYLNVNTIFTVSQSGCADETIPLSQSFQALLSYEAISRLTSVIRHMPMLTSHILMVLSLEPDSRKGPGLPLFLVWGATGAQLSVMLYYKKSERERQGEWAVTAFREVLWYISTQSGTQ